MSWPIHSATDRVLGTAELLRLIFEHSHDLHGRQNYHNALVSKAWSNEALNVLWYKLNSFLPLLMLLGPMGLVEYGGSEESYYVSVNISLFVSSHWRHRNMSDTLPLKTGSFSGDIHGVFDR